MIFANSEEYVLVLQKQATQMTGRESIALSSKTKVSMKHVKKQLYLSGTYILNYQ